MILAKLTPQQITGSLRSTGSTDRDVLFAKKEELLQETRRMKPLTIIPLVVGTILSITIVGAIVGVPMILFGMSVKKSYEHNIRVSDETLAEYMRSLRPSAA